MLNTLIFLDDNYHSISTFPNVSSINQLKQHFYSIWNKLENGIFYSRNLRSTYCIEHCILNTPIPKARLAIFPSASWRHEAISFNHSSPWNTSLGHPMWHTHNGKTLVFPLRHRESYVPACQEQEAIFYRGHVCVCAVWMNPAAADCKWNRREIRAGQRGSAKTPSHTTYKLEPAFLSLYPYSSKAGNRTELQGCAWVLIYHRRRASSDFGVTQTQNFTEHSHKLMCIPD